MICYVSRAFILKEINFNLSNYDITHLILSTPLANSNEAEPSFHQDSSLNSIGSTTTLERVSSGTTNRSWWGPSSGTSVAVRDTSW